MERTLNAPRESSQTVWSLTGRLGEECTVSRITVNASPFRVGRRDEAELSLGFPVVSNLHAEILLDGSRCIVRDLGSTNGTYLNGCRIQQQAEVRPGDILQFANAAFQVGCEHVAEVKLTMATDFADQAFALVQFDRLMQQQLVAPHFQPIVDINSKRVVGFEVLARSRLFGLQSAKELFETALLLNQEAQLSRISRHKGLELAASMSRDSEIFVNTHPAELKDANLEDSLQELRFLNPHQPITLEIHESAITDPVRMRDLRQALNELEIKLAYDDFGAGQARLIELIEVPPDYLKFDMSLVQGASSQHRQLLAMLVQMSRDLGVLPIAEGIESEDQDEACQMMGFVQAQGFLYGKPVPAAAVRRQIRS